MRFDLPPRTDSACACVHESTKAQRSSGADASPLRCRSLGTVVTDDGEDDNSTPKPLCRGTNLLPQIVSDGRKFSKVLDVVILYSRGTATLTF